MKKIITIILAALLLLAVPLPVSAALGISVVNRTGDGVWIGNTWQVDIFPGEEKSTAFTLYSSSDDRLDVEISIRPSSLDNGNLIFELDKSSFIMSDDDYIDVTLIVRVNGSATPGIYTAELEIEFEVVEEEEYVSKLEIYNLRVENITENSADILWTTNRISTSEVTCWSSPKTTIKDKSYVKDHIVYIDNLKQDTTYYFEVFSKDKYKQEIEDKGNFTTLKIIIPEDIEPEIVEPEDIKPEDIEPYVPPPDESKQEIPWGWIGGIIGGLIIIESGLLYWVIKRKRTS